uniref:Interleukin 1 receptor accessory protein n=1 Tax=Sinocyclocheilus rhinocerous TaxID=307959 RepID=A0A673L5R0_9TELE
GCLCCVCVEGSVRVYDGEVAYLYCPLFSYPTLYSYSQTQNSSLSLLWYRHTHTHELEHMTQFYSAVTESVLCSSITVWFGSASKSDIRRLQRTVRTAEMIIGLLLRAAFSPHCFSPFTQMTVFKHLSPVVPDVGSKVPIILNPASDQIYTVTLGDTVTLSCRVHLPHLYEEKQHIWWTIDNKTVEQLADQRFSSLEATYDTFLKERVLNVMDFSADDLQREFNCSARNSRGFNTSRAVLKTEPYVPTLELGCGLGVTLALMLMMFVIYHVFWLELLLLYRSWFGSDERYTDDKQYDVYISYARNSEEEEFVLSTLRRVLETEFGYSVCIFDRDSLPGGTITDDTLRFVGQSRRLVVVVSPCSAVRGTQALLELQAGLTSMLHGGSLRVVLIQFKPVRRKSWVKELRRARLALTLIRWKGEKSAPLSSLPDCLFLRTKLAPTPEQGLTSTTGTNRDASRH